MAEKKTKISTTNFIILILIISIVLIGIKELCESTPLMRIGTPDDVAALALFLASDSASFITGQCIGVDGGFAI